jgi:hypothetical protein
VTIGASEKIFAAGAETLMGAKDWNDKIIFVFGATTPRR